MKKLLSLLLAVVLLTLSVTACAEPEPPAGPKTAVRIGGMKGPTSLGLVKLAEEDANGRTKNDYDIAMTYASANEILPKLTRGELDMAALPANVAATYFANSNGAIRVLAINTLGVVYIVEKGESVGSLSDLAGKRIYAVGKGTTPEYALRYLLSENGVDADSVTFEWKSEATEILPILKTSENAIAMIPQPFVTVASRQVEGLRVALDLNAEWAALENGTQFVTGVLVARREFIEQNPIAVADFLTEYEASIGYANTNVNETAALVVQYGIMDQVPLAALALPHCNLRFLGGAAMKAALSGYLGTLYAANPAAVGGAMPGDTFYYVPGV